MKKWFVILFVLLSALALVACGGGSNGNDSATAPEDTSPETTLDRPEPPAEYAGLENPLDPETAAVDGQTIFQTNCASCHGPAGEGDGPAAAALNPKPASLATNEESLSDAYLHWRISEGGMMEPFNSAMPAWKTILTDDQIWQVVSYIRTLD